MAGISSGELLRQAALILQDAGAVRWTYPELLDYLNAAQRAIVALKPNAATQNVVISLKKGCEQILAANHTVLSRVIRNIINPATMSGGAVLRMLKNREILDAMMPGWMDSTILPFGTIVSYVIYDLATPGTFFVAPGVTADDAALIEVTVGIQPTDIPKPLLPLDLASYVTLTTLDARYFNTLLDFMLYRALTKDGALQGAAVRAAAHKQLFDDAMQGLIGGEGAMSVSTYINGA